MKRPTTTAIALALVLGAGLGPAWAETSVKVTREENKPATVQINAGETVSWVNATGGTAHISFGRGAVQFYLGAGDNRVRLTEPGTYTYATHVSGVKGHAHTGTVVVK